MVRKIVYNFVVRWGGVGSNDKQEKEGRALSIVLLPWTSNTRTHTYIYMCTQTHTNTHMCTHAHKHMWTHPCTYIHTCINTHTHKACTHIHTHAHTLAAAGLRPLASEEASSLSIWAHTWDDAKGDWRESYPPYLQLCASTSHTLGIEA